MLLYFAFGRVAYYTRSDAGPDNLRSCIWLPGGETMFINKKMASEPGFFKQTYFSRLRILRACKG